MSSDWELLPLGEFCEIKQGRYLSPQEMESTLTEASQVPVVGGNGILGYTTHSTYDFGVPLVTCRGSRCGLMQWAEPPTWVSNNAMAVSLRDKNQDNYFLYALLRTLDFDDVISGSAQPQITVSSLSRKVVPTPPEEMRRFIGKLARLIESRIELSSQISSTLESIAQTLFRSWFVDFDPVQAKMRGEKPVGMDDATAALFPDSMEESDLGEIPAGWIAGRLSNLTNLQGGYSFKSSTWTERGVPVVKIGSVKPGFVDLSQVSFVSDELASTVSDIYRLPEGSLVVGLTGYVGEVGLVKKSIPTPLLNQRVAKFIPREGDWKIPFIYCLARDAKFKEKVIEMATGSAQQNVSISQILSIPVVVPNKQILSHFEQLLEPLFRMILQLAVNTETLRLTRDALLPRLISGELQLPEDLVA